MPVVSVDGAGFAKLLGVRQIVIVNGFQFGAVGRVCVAVTALAGLVSSAPFAAAHNVPDALAPTLSYPVSGFVSPKCALAAINPSVDIDNLADPSDDTATAVDATLQFELACNAAVRVAMTSRNGGLKFQGQGSSDPAFSDLVAYRARVDLPGHQNILSCTSERMAGGRTACQRESDGVVGSGKGAVRVQVTPGGGLLLAGKYTDQLTVTVAPLLGGEESGAAGNAHARDD